MIFSRNWTLTCMCNLTKGMVMQVKFWAGFGFRWGLMTSFDGEPPIRVWSCSMSLLMAYLVGLWPARVTSSDYDWLDLLTWINAYELNLGLTFWTAGTEFSFFFSFFLFEPQLKEILNFSAFEDLKDYYSIFEGQFIFILF